MAQPGTPPLLGIPAGADPRAIQLENFNRSRNWEQTLTQQMTYDDYQGNQMILFDAARQASAASRSIKLGALIEHPDIPAIANNASAIQALNNQINARFDQLEVDLRRRDHFYARAANINCPLQGPYLIVPSPIPPHIFPVDNGLPALVNAEAIQNLTNAEANAYIQFYQIHVHIGIAEPVAALPQKKQAIGQAIGLPSNIVASL